jgi:serine/threonine protein kinase
LARADLRWRYKRGARPAAAESLERFPELGGDPSLVLSLIYEEFCLHEEAGERLNAEEFCARYADWKGSLARLLRFHRAISRVDGESGPPPRFPAPGELFVEFVILSELGRGGAARVYRARDRSLNGPVVALKITHTRGNGRTIPPQLGHPNIMPVHSVAFQPATGLLGLCMPYRPGVPLDEAIRRVAPAARQRSARALWQALGQPSAPEGSGPDPYDIYDIPRAEVPPAGGAGWDTFPISGTYAQGTAWVIATLARALHYAQGCGLSHRAVAPTNVLLMYQEGPQLLNLGIGSAVPSPECAEEALRRGTLPYMAPEQLDALLDPRLAGEVGAAADVYALGLLLQEMLTGVAPEGPRPAVPLHRAISELRNRRSSPPASLRTRNRSVPRALDAIAARCLAPAPAGRYRTAGALAEDLERFLAGPVAWWLRFGPGEADERAEALLLRFLDPREKDQYLRTGGFTVDAPSGRRYLITHGVAANVYGVDRSGRRLRRYCIFPRGVPAGDVMLAQRLALLTDEAGFLRTAIATDPDEVLHCDPTTLRALMYTAPLLATVTEAAILWSPGMGRLSLWVWGILFLLLIVGAGAYALIVESSPAPPLRERRVLRIVRVYLLILIVSVGLVGGYRLVSDRFGRASGPPPPRPRVPESSSRSRSRSAGGPGPRAVPR